MVARRCAAVIVAAAVVLAACGDDGESATTTPPPAPVTPPMAPATTTATTTLGWTTPARAVFGVILGWLNGEPIDEAAYRQRFTPAFIQAVPFAAFEQTLVGLRAAGPWTVQGEPEQPTPGALIAELVDASNNRFAFELQLADPAVPVADSALIRPTVDPPGSPEEAQRVLQAHGTLRLGTAGVDDGGCTTITDINANEPMPLGSVFKLYVLGALVDAIEAGQLTWDTPVTIRDELDSIPSGTTQDEPAGSQLSVRELATRMISVSDNTATDHLIDLVGRAGVEAALASYGHETPNATIPFLTTRELAVIKVSGGDLVERYAAATTEERRSLLAGEVARSSLPDIANAAAAPVAVDTVEWFASPLDICRALARLVRSADALEILAVNPGVPAAADRWSYVGFKGGSEPGLLAVAWLVADASGRRFVLAGSVVNTSEPIPDVEAIAAFAVLRDAVA